MLLRKPYLKELKDILYRVQSAECRVQSTEYSLQSKDYRVQSIECQVQCTEHRALIVAQFVAVKIIVKIN